MKRLACRWKKHPQIAHRKCTMSKCSFGSWRKRLFVVGGTTSMVDRLMIQLGSLLLLLKLKEPGLERLALSVKAV